VLLGEAIQQYYSGNRVKDPLSCRSALVSREKLASVDDRKHPHAFGGNDIACLFLARWQTLNLVVRVGHFKRVVRAARQ
jgi:hypothetical protein